MLVVISLVSWRVGAWDLGGRLGCGCSSQGLRRAHSAPMCNATVAGWVVWSGEGSGGGHFLVEGVGVGLLVLDAVEVLAVDVGEGGAVACVAEEQVEHRPHE